MVRLIGTLVERDVSFKGGAAARIKSHAKSHIVELTDGSKWRIWPGDLATTLGWMPEAEIEALPIEDEFCSHVLVDQSDGSRVRATDTSKDWPVISLGMGRFIICSSVGATSASRPPERSFADL